MHTYWWLNALILIPLAGAAGVLATRKSPRTSMLVAGLASIVELVVALVVAGLYQWRGHSGGVLNLHNLGSLKTSSSSIDFVHRVVWARSFGLAYDVGADAISLLLVILSALVVALAIFGARERRSEPAYQAWMLMLLSALVGAFVSRDLLLFFLFFELTLVPSYFLIAGWGRSDRARAALKFFVYTLVGSGFLLVGIIYLGLAASHHFSIPLNFSYLTLQFEAAALSHSAVVLVFVAFALAFAVKSPIWPLHTWSPLAYEQAPTGGSMVLSALLAKLGTYGLLRFCVLMLPEALKSVQPYLMTLAVISILYGSGLAAMSKDLKRLVAYSSLAQVGFITLGVMSGSTIATAGAVLLMFNHGVITAGLFLLVGSIERRRGTTEISALRGLQRPAPVLAAVFTVVMMASIGLPGLSGFVSEFLVLLGTFNTHRWWAVVAATGVIFAALYLLWAYQRVFHGEAREADTLTHDLDLCERWVLVPIVALVIVLGVVPKPVLDRLNPTVNQNVAVVVHEIGR